MDSYRDFAGLFGSHRVFAGNVFFGSYVPEVGGGSIGLPGDNGRPACDIEAMVY